MEICTRKNPCGIRCTKVGCAQQIAGKVHKTRCAKGRLVAAKPLGITLDRLAQYCLLVDTQFCIVRHFGHLMRGY